jgi:limonene-1,2-epoxide hydrolase
MYHSSYFPIYALFTQDEKVNLWRKYADYPDMNRETSMGK